MIEASLARHLAQTTSSDIPAAAIAAAGRSLVDTLAVAWGAHSAAGIQAADRAALADSGDGPATGWISGRRFAVRSAVFVNSVAASALDYDSIYPLAAVHPDIVAVPVAVAMGESVPASGLDVLCAIALGGDLMCRLARGTCGNTGWFYTSVYGAITSAAITARFLGPDNAAVENAMGLGFLRASGTYQPVIERSLSKRMLAALGAEAGVLCGRLGAEGAPGPHDWLTGRYGIQGLYEGVTVEAVLDGLGQVFENARICVKPYPSCQCNHAALDALLSLRREHSLDAGRVCEMEVRISPYMNRLVGAPYEPGDTPQVSAQFSIQYSLARALIDGGLGIDGVNDEAACDARVAALVPRIRVVEDAENHGNYCPATLRLTLVDGTVLERTTNHLRGSLEAPLSDEELLCKLADCLSAGRYDTAARRADQVFEVLMSAHRAPSFAALMTQLTTLVQGSA